AQAVRHAGFDGSHRRDCEKRCAVLADPAAGQCIDWVRQCRRRGKGRHWYGCKRRHICASYRTLRAGLTGSAIGCSVSPDETQEVAARCEGFLHRNPVTLRTENSNTTDISPARLICKL